LDTEALQNGEYRIDITTANFGYFDWKVSPVVPKANKLYLSMDTRFTTASALENKLDVSYIFNLQGTRDQYNVTVYPLNGSSLTSLSSRSIYHLYFSAIPDDNNARIEIILDGSRYWLFVNSVLVGETKHAQLDTCQITLGVRFSPSSSNTATFYLDNVIVSAP
jgi:hypothetical protein